MRKTKPTRTDEESLARVLVRSRSGGFCELRLFGCLGRATDFAHRIGRGVGGQWAASNGLDACRECHSWTHRRPAEAKDLGLMLESWQDSTVEPVAYQNAGLVVLGDDGGLWPVGE